MPPITIEEHLRHLQEKRDDLREQMRAATDAGDRLLLQRSIDQTDSDITKLLSGTDTSPASVATADSTRQLMEQRDANKGLTAAEAARLGVDQAQVDVQMAQVGVSAQANSVAYARAQLEHAERNAYNLVMQDRNNIDRAKLMIDQAEGLLKREHERLKLTLDREGMELSARGTEMLWDTTIHTADVTAFAAALQAETQRRGQDLAAKTAQENQILSEATKFATDVTAQQRAYMQDRVPTGTLDYELGGRRGPKPEPLQFDAAAYARAAHDERLSKMQGFVAPAPQSTETVESLQAKAPPPPPRREPWKSSVDIPMPEQPGTPMYMQGVGEDGEPDFSGMSDEDLQRSIDELDQELENGTD